MKVFADFLEKTDGYFAGKSSNERWALILLPAALIAYLAWSLLMPPAVVAHDTSETKKSSARKQLKEHKEYLRGITVNGDRDYRVKELNKKIEKETKRAQVYRDKISLLDVNMKELSDMLFNRKSWSKFLDSITANAQENNVTLTKVDNRYVDGNGSFGHVLEMGIKCQGDFQGIDRFMNDLEQNVLVTDIFDSRIYTDTNSTHIYADINISVWGVNH